MTNSLQLTWGLINVRARTFAARSSSASLIPILIYTNYLLCVPCVFWSSLWCTNASTFHHLWDPHLSFSDTLCHGFGKRLELLALNQSWAEPVLQPRWTSCRCFQHLVSLETRFLILNLLRRFSDLQTSIGTAPLHSVLQSQGRQLEVGTAFWRAFWMLILCRDRHLDSHCSG